jgi:hypothetical protein
VVPKRHKRDRGNLDKAISFDQKDACMYSLRPSRHVSTHGQQWLLLISLTQLPLPLVLDWFRSKVQNHSQLTKGLRGGLRHMVWWAVFMGNGIQKKKQELLNNTSNLRWQHKEH